MTNQFTKITAFMTAFLIGSATTFSVGRNSVAVPLDAAVVENSEPVSERFQQVDEDLSVIYGWYALDEFKGMREVTMIYIYDPGGVDDDASGGVFTNLEEYGDQGFFGKSRIAVINNSVTFTTEQINGISYEFDGTFPEGRPAHQQEGAKPLYGTLQKFVKGKMVAQASGNFEYFEPHCWH